MPAANAAGETLPKRIVSALGYRVIRRIADVEIPPNGRLRPDEPPRGRQRDLAEGGSRLSTGLVGLVGFRR